MSASDLRFVADLVETHPEAAARLAALAADHEEATARLSAVEFELSWLLKHARELPVWVVRTDEELFESAQPAGPASENPSYVLADCPRLRSLIAGEIPAARGAR